MSSAPPLDVTRILAETSIREVCNFDELASTNTTAIELSRDMNRALPQLVIAQSQTTGRGRGANTWWSAPGALTFSMLSSLPDAACKNPGLVSLATGIAICNSIESIAPQCDPKLKWPNDVFLNEKKVCGILIEKPANSAGRLVIGIGINVANSLSLAPVEIQATATSILDETGRTLDLTDVLVVCLQQIEMAMALLEQDSEPLVQEFQRYCFLTDRRVTINAGGNRCAGVCLGIDENGALVLFDGTTEHHFVGGVVEGF